MALQPSSAAAEVGGSIGLPHQPLWLEQPRDDLGLQCCRHVAQLDQAHPPLRWQQQKPGPRPPDRHRTSMPLPRRGEWAGPRHCSHRLWQPEPRSAGLGRRGRVSVICCFGSRFSQCAFFNRHVEKDQMGVPLESTQSWGYCQSLPGPLKGAPESHAAFQFFNWSDVTLRFVRPWPFCSVVESIH